MRLAIAAAFSVIALCACSGRGSSADAVYSVRGRVVEATGSGADLRVVVAHEAIPAFKDRDGKVAEMPAMQMAFGVDPTLAPSLTPGSGWELTFAVRWNQEPVLLITAAKPLPAGSPLGAGQ